LNTPTALIAVILLGSPVWGQAPQYEFTAPRLETPPVIDGDLGEWRDRAFTDGVWDIERLRHTPWFEADRNRLTNHGEDESPIDDLRARYYVAWDEEYLYFGAEVLDNVNDSDDPAHEDSRWYYKDCVCWFVEAPRDDLPEEFGQGGNGFCFVIDPSRPSYGAWWRHGNAKQTYIEEPLPKDTFEYQLRMDPWGRSPGDFILEAKVAMAPTLGVSDPTWRAPRNGDEYGLSVVHTDPDGGPYGGHFLVYGIGRNDGYWARMFLGGPAAAIERRSE
jgi:hypothetical protein